MNCIIIEDEPLAQEVLAGFIQAHPSLQLKGVFDEGMKALDVLAEDSIELIFLDINLPKISGINFYKTLKKRPQVIFTTAYSEHAVTGFELEATDYLMKPIGLDRFLLAVNRALEKRQNQSEGHLLIKTDKKHFRIPFDDIKLIVSMGDFVKIQTSERNYISSQTLKQLEQILPKPQFIRIHKSYIIATAAIEYLEGNQVKIGSEKFPVGQSYRDAVDRIFRG